MKGQRMKGPELRASYDAKTLAGKPCGRGQTEARTGCTPKAVTRGQERQRESKQATSSGVLQMKTVPMRKRRGSALDDDQRQEAIAYREGALTELLEDAQRALSEGDLDGMRQQMRRATVLGQVSNADWWFEQSDGADMFRAADELLGSNRALIDAQATVYQVVGDQAVFNKVRVPDYEPPFPDGHDEKGREVSPYTGERYENFRSQTNYREVRSQILAPIRAAIARGERLTERESMVTQGDVLSFMASLKRQMWREKLEEQRGEAIRAHVEKYLPAEEKARSEPDEVPF